MLPIRHCELEHLTYEQAYQKQLEHHECVLKSRDSDHPELARIMMVEHPPTITVTKRPDAQSHIISSQSNLESLGITVHETDRGGDVTYHGPGQLVCYPIVDLNAAKLRIHNYIRLLEQVVIDTLQSYDIIAHTDPAATGVWVAPNDNPKHSFISEQPAKICAIGVRVRKWITLHGLALNLDPQMDHFNHIIPCGLANRPVISITQILGQSNSPTLAYLSQEVDQHLHNHLTKRMTDPSQ